MRKLLENKWVVVALGIVAVATLVWTFRSQWMGIDQVNARSADVLPVDANDPTGMTASAEKNQYISMILNRWVPSPEIATFKQAGMDAEPRRDPFVFPPRQNFDPSVPGSETNAAAGPPALELQAISIHGTNGLAVINRVVVSVGEQLQGYSVQQVSRDEVGVFGYGERRVLRLDFSSPPAVPAPDAETKKP